MLVVEGTHGLLRLVRQADHARIAGAFAARWGNEDFAPPTPGSAALAADLHDEGWVEPDGQPLLATTGRPLNFVDVDLRDHAEFYGRAVQLAMEEDPYAALLISMHWTGLYCGRWGWQSSVVFNPPAELRVFLHELVVEQQHAWVGMTEQAWDRVRSRRLFESGLWTDYELLQVWDILSLFICRTDLSEETETLITAVPRDLNGQAVNIVVGVPGDGSITLDPYPFAEDGFEVVIPALEIPDRAYPNQGAVSEEIHEAGITETACHIGKA